MPSIYEYFGILLLFHTRDHFITGVHVHARYGDYENKYEFQLKDGEVIKITKQKVVGKEQLPNAQAKDAEKLIDAKKDSIIKKFEQIFIENRKVKIVRITRKL